MVKRCEKYEELAKCVEHNLANITECTSAQLEAFHADNHQKMLQLDKHLEQLVGEKERSIGALREHMKEHRCRGVQ